MKRQLTCALTKFLLRSLSGYHKIIHIGERIAFFCGIQEAFIRLAPRIFATLLDITCLEGRELTEESFCLIHYIDSLAEVGTIMVFHNLLNVTVQNLGKQAFSYSLDFRGRSS